MMTMFLMWQVYELVPGGAKVAVTDANKVAYVKAYVEARLHGLVRFLA
jgi:hypothetical protein